MDQLLWPRNRPTRRAGTVLVTEYADDAAFARKSAVKDAYKKALLDTHPEWKRINDTKTQIRNDLDETLARAVPLN